MVRKKIKHLFCNLLRIHMEVLTDEMIGIWNQVVSKADNRSLDEKRLLLSPSVVAVE